MAVSRLMQCVLAGVLAMAGTGVLAQTNILKQNNERQLAVARALAPENPAMKAEMLITQAAALDNLGQSEQGLLLVEQALALATPDQRVAFNITKGTILLSMGRAPESLALLGPLLENERRAAAAFAPAKRAMALSEYQSGFISATFASIEQGDFKGALAYLADAESTPDDTDFPQYRAVVYRYIMARANDAALANPNLEKQAVFFAETSKSHYGALLRMWQGANNLPELAQAVAAKSGAEQADAQAEALFYMGAYAKFSKHDAVAARNALDQLNQMAPYGSLEWVHGRRTLNL